MNSCPLVVTLFAYHLIIIILPTVNRILEERINICVINRSSNDHIQGNNEFPIFFLSYS